MARAAVSALRLAQSFVPAVPEVDELVQRLYQRSEAFRGLWDDQRVAGLSATHKTIRHPDVGVLELSFQTFDVRSAPGQQLTVATAATGSPAPMRWPCWDRWALPAARSTPSTTADPRCGAPRKYRPSSDVCAAR